MEEFKNTTTENKYYLAHNELDVFHYGILISQQVVATGQPLLEIFDDIDEFNERLIELGQEELDENLEYKNKINVK